MASAIGERYLVDWWLLSHLLKWELQPDRRSGLARHRSANKGASCASCSRAAPCGNHAESVWQMPREARRQAADEIEVARMHFGRERAVPSRCWKRRRPLDQRRHDRATLRTIVPVLADFILAFDAPAVTIRLNLAGPRTGDCRPFGSQGKPPMSKQLFLAFVLAVLGVSVAAFRSPVHFPPRERVTSTAGPITASRPLAADSAIQAGYRSCGKMPRSRASSICGDHLAAESWVEAIHVLQGLSRPGATTRSCRCSGWAVTQGPAPGPASARKRPPARDVAPGWPARLPDDSRPARSGPVAQAKQQGDFAAAR